MKGTHERRKAAEDEKSSDKKVLKGRQETQNATSRSEQTKGSFNETVCHRAVTVEKKAKGVVMFALAAFCFAKNA